MNFIEALFKISWEALRGGVWHDRVMVLALWLPIITAMILNLSTLADADKLRQVMDFLSQFTQPLSI